MTQKSEVRKRDDRVEDGEKSRDRKRSENKCGEAI